MRGDRAIIYDRSLRRMMSTLYLNIKRLNFKVKIFERAINFKVKCGCFVFLYTVWVFIFYYDE